MFPYRAPDSHLRSAVLWPNTPISTPVTLRRGLDKTQDGIKSGWVVFSTDKPKCGLDFFFFFFNDRCCFCLTWTYKVLKQELSGFTLFKRVLLFVWELLRNDSVHIDVLVIDWRCRTQLFLITHSSHITFNLIPAVACHWHVSLHRPFLLILYIFLSMGCA